jgi:dihydrofolate reductase
MPSAHVFIATSLDGFIARVDGGLDWLDPFNSEEEDYGYGAHIARMDGLIMGRATYEKVLTFDSWFYEKPVMVLSRTLEPSSVPPELAGKVEIVPATPEHAMQIAAERGWHRVYVDGGALIQSFLREGLIEDMIISRVPVLIGSGLPLFGALPGDIALDHIETRAFASGLVQSRYRVRPS